MTSVECFGVLCLIAVAPTCCAIVGPPGCGKSFLVRQVEAVIRSERASDVHIASLSAIDLAFQPHIVRFGLLLPPVLMFC